MAIPAQQGGRSKSLRPNVAAAASTNSMTARASACRWAAPIGPSPRGSRRRFPTFRGKSWQVGQPLSRQGPGDQKSRRSVPAGKGDRAAAFRRPQHAEHDEHRDRQRKVGELRQSQHGEQHSRQRQARKPPGRIAQEQQRTTNRRIAGRRRAGSQQQIAAKRKYTGDRRPHRASEQHHGRANGLEPDLPRASPPESSATMPRFRNSQADHR